MIIPNPNEYYRFYLWGPLEPDPERQHRENIEKQMSEDMHNPGTDNEWEKIHEVINKDAADRNLTDVDVFVIWRLGLAAWETSRKYGAKFPHE